MAGLQTEKIAAPSRGLDQYSAAAYVKEGQGVSAANVIPARPGRAPMRGAITLSQKGRGTFNAGAGAGAWSGLTSGGVAAGLIYEPLTGTTARYLEFGAGNSGSTQPTVITAPTPIRALFAGTATLGGFVWGSDGVLVRWTPGGSSVTRRTAATPAAPAAVAEYNSRLFISNNNNLYWSDAGGPIVDNTAAWTDDVTGLLNHIVMGDSGDNINAMCKVDRALILLRSKSIWRLTGDTPGNYDVRRVAEVGCISSDGVLEYDNGVFFQSKEGIMFFDGVEVTCISNALDLNHVNDGALGPHFYSTRVGREFVMFHLLDPSYVPGSPPTVTRASRWLLYHVPTGSWTEVTMDAALSLGTPFGFWVNTNSSEVLMANGSSYSLASIAGDYNVLKDGDPYVYAAGDTAAPPLSVVSRVTRLAAPQKKVQLHRLMFDYVLKDATASLGVTVKDELGNVIVPELTLPGAATAIRQRAVFDAFQECSSVQLVWRYIGGSAPGPVEIHDAWFEFQAAADRTG